MNIAFGLERIQGKRKAEIAETVETLLNVLHLADFRATAFPRIFRVACASASPSPTTLALSISPILLMDEPSRQRLDALTRRNLRDELLRIWETFSEASIVFVTSRIEESIYLCRLLSSCQRPIAPAPSSVTSGSMAFRVRAIPLTRRRSNEPGSGNRGGHGWMDGAAAARPMN